MAGRLNGRIENMESAEVSLQTIQRRLDRFISTNPKNVVAELDMMQIYDRPLVGVANAKDTLWKKLKEPNVIGPLHLSPTDWFEWSKIGSFLLPAVHRKNSHCQPLRGLARSRVAFRTLRRRDVLQCRSLFFGGNLRTLERSCGGSRSGSEICCCAAAKQLV